MRVKRGIVRHRRHKKILKLAKGYRGMRSTTFVHANEAVIRAGVNAYRDRRIKKRTFRGLWIIRLNAALRAQGIRYSVFVNALKAKNVLLNRKVLSELAIHESAAFDRIVKEVAA
ncbi:MAG: 50S ribosomal protein L20 [Candidatus Peribacteraceae bacterium]|nr:50S ribosomal protein L20 [Candidatus Peribacteraceae bacterium]